MEKMKNKLFVKSRAPSTMNSIMHSRNNSVAPKDSKLSFENTKVEDRFFKANRGANMSPIED